MTKVYILLFSLSILLFAGCTKNNQNSPANFAYLNVNETFISANNDSKFYDIDNDGVVDWGFGYEGSSGYIHLSPYEGLNFSNLRYVVDSLTPNSIGSLKILPVGFTISSSCLFDGYTTILEYNSNQPQNNINTSLLGSGDFYIGFRTQNPQFTNTFFGWARLNLSADGNTLIVKDMALNTVNGGSINVGQH